MTMTANPFSFTNKQIGDWKRYEVVRKSGRINMFDSIMGCKLSGLTKEEYLFCMSNYDELARQAGER